MTSRRVQGFTESVIREMTRINNQHGGINLAGAPHHAQPELGQTKIRFCFPKTDDMLIEAGQRLLKRAR